MTPREKPPFYRDSPGLGFLSFPVIYYTILDWILTPHIPRDRDLSSAPNYVDQANTTMGMTS